MICRSSSPENVRGRTWVVMAPCNGCYHNLKKAEYDLAHDPQSVEVVDRLSKKAGHATYQAGQVGMVQR